MKILLLATRDPAGPPSGRKSVLRTILRSVVSLGHDIELVVLSRQRPTITDSPGIRVWHVSPPGTARVLTSIATKAIAGRQTLNECLYDSPAVARRVREIAEQTRSDVVIADMIRTAEVAFATGRPVVLDLDDLLSRRYRQMATGKVDVSTVLGYHRENLPRAVSHVAGHVAGRVVGWEASRMQRREIECARRASVVSLVSPTEGVEFAARTGRHVECLPMAVECPSAPAAVRSNPPRMLLTAKLDYGQNLDALRWYRHEVVPHLNGSGIRLEVIGACPTSVRDELECDALQFRGYVDDLWSALTAGRAFLAPIVSGTGVKNKVLEAMAAGLPAVTTPMGVSGIAVKDGVDCLVAGTGREFADKVHLVARDADRAAKIGLAARALVERTYSPIIVEQRWRKVLAELDNRQPTART